MATETLEDKKPEQEPHVKDKQETKGQQQHKKDEDDPQIKLVTEVDETKEEHTSIPKIQAVGEVDSSEEQNVQQGKEVGQNNEEKKKQDEHNPEEEEGEQQVEKEEDEEEAEQKVDEDEDEEEAEQEVEKDEDEDAEHEGEQEEEEEEEEVEEGKKVKAKERRKGSAKEDQSSSKKPRKVDEQKTSKKLSEKKGGNDPATPASDRPTRERKTVERYSVPSPEKFGRSSAGKVLSIEKGRGTQLKDIPNVAFKLSKRKPDDNLRILHSILFGKKAKAQSLKRNIGQFSGYVWADNEEKQRAKVKDKLDKCVKEKLVNFCDVLNIPINKNSVKKEELSVKLLEFLESPHATTEVLLADKEQKGRKRTRKVTPSKSSGEAFVEMLAKKQEHTAQDGKKRKRSSEVEENNVAESSDVKHDSQDDEDVSVPNDDSDHDGSQSEEGKAKPKANKLTSKKTAKQGSVAKTGDRTMSVKKATVKAAKSNEKMPKKSTLKKSVTDQHTASASLSKSKQSSSKKQKTGPENQDWKGMAADQKKTEKSSKALDKDPGKGKRSKKAKGEPSKAEMHDVIADILKEVDFNTATLSDILRQLGSHFGLDLMHRKGEVKDIITDVINEMSDTEDEAEEAEDGDDDDA